MSIFSSITNFAKSVPPGENQSGFGAMAYNAAGSGGNAGNIAGSLANEGLNLAASAIPFGTVVKDILDKLGLQENINLVSKYGISSWGASTSPEEAKALIAKNVAPYVEQKMQSVNVANVSEVVNEVEDILLANHYFFSAMRDHHSRAKSTKMANEMTQKEFKKLANDFITAVRAEFNKYGVKFTRVASNETGRQLAESGKIYNLKDNKSWVGGPSRDLDRYLAKQYYNWNVDYSNVKGLEKDENGNVTKKSSSGLLTLAGLGFAAFKFLK